MKYILIIGRANDGKSTTMEAVCKLLKPLKIQRLNVPSKKLEEQESTVSILNGTYVINVNGKIILVVAGAPTEQGFSITVIIKICIELDIKIDWALVSMRSFERSNGFHTRMELEQYGECILEERIWRINNPQFNDTDAWKSRINKIVNLIDNDD